MSNLARSSFSDLPSGPRLAPEPGLRPLPGRDPYVCLHCARPVEEHHARMGNCPDQRLSGAGLTRWAPYSPPATPTEAATVALSEPELGRAEPLTMDDLVRMAEFLARESFDCQIARAMWQPDSWYREQVGEDVCTAGQAGLLRRLTIGVCREQLGRPDPARIASALGTGLPGSEQRALERSRARLRHLSRFALLSLLMAALVGLALLLMANDTPIGTGEDRYNVNAPGGQR